MAVHIKAERHQILSSSTQSEHRFQTDQPAFVSSYGQTEHITQADNSSTRHQNNLYNSNRKLPEESIRV